MEDVGWVVQNAGGSVAPSRTKEEFTPTQTVGLCYDIFFLRKLILLPKRTNKMYQDDFFSTVSLLQNTLQKPNVKCTMLYF